MELSSKLYDLLSPSMSTKFVIRQQFLNPISTNPVASSKYNLSPHSMLRGCEGVVLQGSSRAHLRPASSQLCLPLTISKKFTLVLGLYCRSREPVSKFLDCNVLVVNLIRNFMDCVWRNVEVRLVLQSILEG